MLATITVLALPPRESAHNRERGIASVKKKQTKQYETKTKRIYIIADDILIYLANIPEFGDSC